ncbi:MAG: double-cubane-cluster-containing anaerobic reductase [Methylomonas sp.]|nr:double-cubane-cluster-containing anaerobic reductase [Methylomonas sp.]
MSAIPEHEIESGVQRHARHQGMEAGGVLDQVERGFAGNPKAMQYFYDLFRDVYCEGVKPHPDKQTIGTMCVQIPDEIIHAAGGVPVRMCNGFYTDEELGSEFMPAKSCSLVKASLGMLKSQTNPYSAGIQTIVNPTTCDQKKKAAGMMREMGYDVYDMELPPVKESEEGREYWRRSVRKFTQHIGKLTGKKVTRRNLKQTIQQVGRAQLAYHRLNELRKHTPIPILGKDIFMVTNAYFFDDLARWTRATEALCAEIEARVAQGYNAAGRRSPRIVFTGSPPVFPNLKLPLMIEQADGVIVADETCSSNRLLNDMVSVDEWFMYDMVDAVADRYLKSCTCPIFTMNDDRIRRLIELYRTFNADGIIYQAFAGCSVYEMEQRSVAKAMEKEGIPMLYIETDYSPSHAGQLSTRVEAFIESLKSRRRQML